MGLTSSNFMVFTLIFTVSLSQGCKNAVAHSRRAAKSLGVRELDLQRRSIARSFASGIPFVPQSYLISRTIFSVKRNDVFLLRVVYILHFMHTNATWQNIYVYVRY